MVASAKPKTLSVKGKSSSLSYSNVLIGEVWLCSGQSNMGWAVNSSDDSDLEIMTANFPDLRLISVPQVGTQEPQDDFNGQWEATTPDVAKNFSAVGYFFGRRLHQPGSLANASMPPPSPNPTWNCGVKQKPNTMPRPLRRNTKNKKPNGPSKSRKPRQTENPTPVLQDHRVTR